MLHAILRYGTIAGVIVAIPTFGVPVSIADPLPGNYGLLIGYTSMLVSLSLVFAGIKHHRDRHLGGVIRFWPALGLGLGISFVASIFYVVAWEAALAVTGMDFAGDYARQLIEQKRAAGATAAEIAAFAAQMASFTEQYANPLYRLPMTFSEVFPIGVLVSLVSAALLRNDRFLPARS